MTTYPYVEGFENGPAWTSGGTSSDWAWGSPAHPLIDTPASGSNAWCVGGLQGTFYNYGQQSWLESPCFDLTDLEFPWISFKLFWEIEQQFDGLGFQYSLNGGGTWTNVGSFNSPADCMNQNWFNTGFISTLLLADPKQGWSGRVGATQANCIGGGGSGTWVTASHCLTDLAGETDVRFRFVFGAGTMCNSYDGIGIDDVFIGDAPANEASFLIECVGTQVNFQSNSSHCPSTYLWNFDDPASGAANTSNAPDPSHAFPGPGTYEVSLTVAGPCNATSTIVRPVTIIDVALEVEHPGCAGNDGSLTAIVSATGSPLQYQWSPAGPNSPENTGLSSGTYSLVVSGTDACPVTVSATLQQEASPLEVDVEHEDITCAGAGDGWAEATVVGSSGPLTYAWSPGGQNTPSIQVATAGTYSVLVTGGDGCSGTAEVVVNEPEALQLTVTESMSVCLGASLVLEAEASGGTPPYSLVYSPEGPVVSPQENSTYDVQVTDAAGCSLPAAEITVLVGGPEPPVIGLSITEGCAPVCVDLTGSGNGIMNWMFGDGGEASGEFVQHCFDAGTHDITLQVIDEYGCISATILEDTVNVLPSPTAAFYAVPQVTTIERPEITFIQFSSGAADQLWSFGDPEERTSVDHSPRFTYPEVGCYEVVLSVTSGNECTDTTSLEVCVEDEFIVHSPTAFTPNEDGLNDIFLPHTSVRSPELFQMRIYDRWGSIVFASEGHQGWDGSTGGTELPAGIYIWTLRMRDTLGALQERQGHVTLVR